LVLERNQCCEAIASDADPWLAIRMTTATIEQGLLDNADLRLMFDHK
jgi:hypothetical protein